MAMGNKQQKIWKSLVMRLLRYVSGQTNRHAHHNTLHLYRVRLSMHPPNRNVGGVLIFLPQVVSS